MKKIFTLLTVIAMVATTVQAQYYYLPFTNAGTNPGGINVDNEYPVGGGLPTGWAQISAATNPTPVWTVNQTLPFTFLFDGVAVTHYKVSTSGVLTFDVGTALAAPSYTRAALPNAAIPDSSVCIWGLASLGTNDYIIKKTFGTAPNRQLWIQFSSYGYGTVASSGSAFTYWSIVLEETTNNIYIVDNRTGGYPTTKKVSAGVQINSTTAYSVSGSPDLNSLAGTDPSPADNSYYQFIQGTQAANEAALVSLNINKFVVAPTTGAVAGTITNYGSAAITDITINYSVNGGPPVADNKTGLNIAFGSSYNFTHATNVNIPVVGPYNLVVWVDLTGDGNHINDTLTSTISALSFLPTKNVVFEEATGTWCGWCPRGAVYMDSLKNLHPNTAMLIAVHNSDPMVVPAYDAAIGSLIGGYPSGLVDRKDNDVDPATFIAEYDARIQDVPPCDVDVVAMYNPSGLVGSFTITAHFAGDLNGDYRFNAVVTEDDVTGTTSAWDQHNYYSYQSQNIALQGAGHNWQAEPQVIPAADMVYDHVAREILGGWDGTAGSLPTSIAANSSYNYTYTYTIPANFDISQLHVIGWVCDASTGNILNANMNIGPLVAGLHENSNEVFKMRVAPNPMNESNGKVFVTFKQTTDVTFQVIDVLGNIVRSSSQSNISAGDYIYPLNLDGLSNGIYNIRIVAANQALTQRLILAH